MRVFIESTEEAATRAEVACGRTGFDHEDRSIRSAWGRAARLEAVCRNNRMSLWMGGQIWYMWNLYI